MATQNEVQSGSSTAVNVETANPPVATVAEPVSPAGGSASPTAGPILTGFALSLQQMLQGVEQYIPDGSTIGGLPGQQSTQSLTKADIVAHLQGWIAAYAAVSPVRQQLTVVRQAVKSQLPAARQYYAQLKAALQLAFIGSPLLEEFGLKPKKTAAKLSSAALAVRAVKAKATRALRGTTSKKQKQTVRYSGTVTPAVATPVEPQAPATAAPVVAKTAG